MTVKSTLDVFDDNDFLTRATHRLGLRGDVLDTKFGARYDVTKPLVLTIIRQDVSAVKRVAGMISPPRQHTSCSPKVISASAAIANLLHYAHMLWTPEHHFVVVGCAKNRSPCGATSHGLGTVGLLYFRFVLLASVLGRVDVAVFQDKTNPSRGFRITLRVLLFT